MKFDPTLYNFVSPFTGRVSANTDLVLIGDKDNIATPSPIIKHLRLDFIKIKKDLDDLTILTDKINEIISKPFSLSSLPPLGAAKFPLPNPDILDGLYSTIIPNFVVDTFKAAVSLAATVPIPNPIFDPLNPLSYIMFGPWLPQVIAGSPNFLNTSSENVISSTVAMLHINTAQIMKRFDNANFIVKSRKVDFEWDNPAYFAANLSPNLRAAMDLYNLNPTYTFTEAQALDELKDSITGERRSGVLATNGLGEIKLAIGGSDYVDYNPLTYGPMCVINPLASVTSNKFISKSTKIKTRPNSPREFGRRVKIQDDVEVPEVEEEVLDVELFKATDMRLDSVSDVHFDSDDEGARLLGYDYNGRFLPVIKDKTDPSNLKFFTAKNLIELSKYVDTTSPNSISDISNKLNKISLLVRALVGVNDVVDIYSVTVDSAKNLNKIVKAIGGIQDTVDMVDVTATDAGKLVKAVKSVVGVVDAVDIASTAAKAADVFTNKASLIELEAQIAALAGVAEINTLWNLFNTIGIVTTAVGGYHYGQYIRGQTLNVKNTWDSTDLNDECANATGAFRPFEITPYSYEDRGHGTLWFDSNGHDSGNYNYNSKAGLRLFSWDSSTTDTFDSELSPLHIGLFGYRKYATTPDEYKGFIFNAEFDNDKKSLIPGIIDNDNYRFPTKFGLYDVHRTISSLGNKRYGWDRKETVFEYDYSSFNFEKPLRTKSLTITENLTIPSKLSTQIPINSQIGSMFYCSDL